MAGDVTALAIGVDVGGTRTKLGVVDVATGKVLELAVAPTITDDAARFLDAIASAARRWATRLPIAVLGIGVPGYVEAGVVDTTFGFLPFMDAGGFDVGRALADRTGLRVRVDNDARLMALGEARFGAGRGARRVLGLTLGTGLGCGVVVDGAFREEHPREHMAGHVPVAHAAASSRCACGRAGCLESLVNAAALVSLGREQGLDARDARDVLGADDPRAHRAVAAYLDRLAVGLDAFAQVLAPDRIVIGGGVALGLRPHLAALTKACVARPFRCFRLDVRLAELGDAAAVIGAAALAAERAP
jgi:glucokinase